MDKSKKKKKKGDKQQNVSSLRTICVCLPHALYAEEIQLQYSCALVYICMFCMMCSLIIFHQISFSTSHA